MFLHLLHRIDPDLHMARYYRVEVSYDLFGVITLERRWGRIGGRGQSRRVAYPTIDHAQEAALKLIRTKARRGYCPAM